MAPASSAPTMTSVRRSSRIRDRSRPQRRARLVSDGKGMFVGVVQRYEKTNRRAESSEEKTRKDARDASREGKRMDR